jgi:DNA-binding GntR family transcriptional regulator
MTNSEEERSKALLNKKELLSETVYRAIHKMIASHRYEPGLRVNVEKIAREVGVSRTPAREAIRRLEQEGIVKAIPNRGVFMLENPLERVLEIMEARGALDRLAGRLACSRVRSRILYQLDRCLDNQLGAVDSGDLALYSSTDVRFHGLIYEASGNAYLRELFDSIVLQMLPARIHILPILSALYLGHQEILQALKDRNTDGVEDALTRHTDLIMNHTKEMIRTAHERKEMVKRIRATPLRGGGRRKMSEAKKELGGDPSTP